MKSTVEQLSPTRVRINVEVPFEELKPDFDRAYKTLARTDPHPGLPSGQGARPSCSRRVSAAAPCSSRSSTTPCRPATTRPSPATEVKVLGQPEIEITKLEDGEELTFTAEVDVRPEITLPDFSTDRRHRRPDRDHRRGHRRAAAVAASALRHPHRRRPSRAERRLRLHRPVGDRRRRRRRRGRRPRVCPTRSVPASSSRDSTTRSSALTAGESKDFTTTLVAGEHAGKEAVVTVTVNSVKERELPEADDEFAQLASEFDTLDELTADLRERVERVKKVEQAGQIRDKVLEALLETVEIPLPEAVVQAEVDARSARRDPRASTTTRTQFDKLLEAQGSSREEFDKEARESAERSVKTQLLLDAIAEAEGTTSARRS